MNKSGVILVIVGVFLVMSVCITMLLLSEDIVYDEDRKVVYVKKRDDKIDEYLGGEFNPFGVKKEYTASIEGIGKMLDVQRGTLKEKFGPELYNKYVKNGALDILDVKDDGKTLTVYANDSEGIMYHGLVNVGLLRERQNLLVGLLYVFGDRRDVEVKFGYVTKNKYNKNEFVMYDTEIREEIPDNENVFSTNEYLFKSSEVRKVEDWNNYSVYQLLELNEYNDKK